MNKPVRTALFGAGLIGALVAGGATASFAQSAVNSGSSTTQAPASTPAPPSSNGSGNQQAPAQGQRPQFDPSKGGHTANGITETLLTGDTATKVTDAAKAAVPGATIERVETDAEGAAYEAHVVTSDGTHKTVTFNADYSVVAIQDDQMGHGPGGQGGQGGPGMGHGGRGTGAPNGQAPANGQAPVPGQQSTPSTQQGS